MYLALKNAHPEEEIKVCTRSYCGYDLHNGLEIQCIFGVNLKDATLWELSNLAYPFFNYKTYQIMFHWLPKRRSMTIGTTQVPFNPSEVTRNDSVFYDGYWQNENFFKHIRSKIYAKDVRTAIVNAISQCYDDVNAPALRTEAMQAAVQAKIDAGEMAALTIADGSLTGAKLANGTIPTAKIADGAITAAKLASGAVPTDTTLMQSGIPADAKTVGDKLDDLNEGLNANDSIIYDITTINPETASNYQAYITSSNVWGGSSSRRCGIVLIPDGVEKVRVTSNATKSPIPTISFTSDAVSPVSRYILSAQGALSSPPSGSWKLSGQTVL